MPMILMPALLDQLHLHGGFRTALLDGLAAQCSAYPVYPVHPNKIPTILGPVCAGQGEAPAVFKSPWQLRG